MSLHKDVKDYFAVNWNSANTSDVLPVFYYVEDIKEFKHKESRLIFYDRSGEESTPGGLGYNTENIEDSFGIEIYTNVSQALADLFQTESLRLWVLIRKSSLSMDVIRITNKGIPRSVPGYSMYGYVQEFVGKKYGKAI